MAKVPNPETLPRPLRSRNWLLILLALVLSIPVLWWTVGRTAVSYYRVSQWQEAALAEEKANHFEAAAEIRLRCARAIPDSAELRFDAARAARRAGQFSDAAKLLDEADKLGWVENAILLERYLLRLQQGELRLVEDYLKACVLNDHPDSSLILELLVPAYVQVLDLPMARRFAEIWAEKYPDDVRPFLFLGDILERLFQNSESLVALKRAVDIAPDDAEAHRAFGVRLLANQRAAEAAEQFQYLIDHPPVADETRLLMAQALVATGDPERARAQLAQLPAMTKTALADYLNGKILLQAGDAAKAADLLKRSLDQEKWHSDRLFTYAQALDQLGKKDEAEKVRQQFTKLEADLKTLQATLLRLWQEPTSVDLRKQIGTTLIQTGRVQAGVDWLLTAIGLAPRDAELHERVAEAYAQLGDRFKAEYYRKKADELSRAPRTRP